MRRGLREALISTAALAILLIAIVSMDARVHDRVVRLLPGTGSGSGSAEIAGIARQAGDTATVVMKAARDQSVEQAPLLIFVCAATVLVLFMVRT